MPFHRIARHRVLATGVAPSAAGDDLTACDAYVNHHEVLAVARQIRTAQWMSSAVRTARTGSSVWQPVRRTPP